MRGQPQFLLLTGRDGGPARAPAAATQAGALEGACIRVCAPGFSTPLTSIHRIPPALPAGEMESQCATHAPLTVHARSPMHGVGFQSLSRPRAQLAGMEDQHARPPPPPMQGCSPGRRLGHAGDQTSAETHGLLSGGVVGCCSRPAARSSAKAASAFRRPCIKQQRVSSEVSD